MEQVEQPEQPVEKLESGNGSEEEAERAKTDMLPGMEGKAVASADENSNFDQYSAIKQTKRLQNNLTEMA